METIILDMIKQAEKEENYQVINYAKRLIEELASTFNAPSNWRYIGENLTEMYDESAWVYEELELWNYED